ncbi:nucleotide exchange factor GrpE [Aerosticca soli]|jgi:molecular chaperone GrpE|uniref:Protein GrpE n=1 Tax=Aerosticca soli TaxID=2010829 RepID=A0A2Z6E477_9GAMM|nr:nucleotide exchange factor GrpE [Aerosticca soli]MDI3261734.1 nucleotide exchange factor GrpE [Fulvimonas sp.]BBD79803.1 heat shock protein GrpE [Aerosticca soli]
MQTNEPQTPPSSQNASSQPAGQEAKALAAELEQLRARLAELEASNAELRETVLREKAELENQRRRLHRDLEQARRFANEKLLGDLLPVYDNLERGLAAEGSDIAALREGIELTLKAMLKVAESHGLRPIDPLGEPLDPEKHHAVSMVEAPDQKPGTVVNVLQKGYVLNDRLVRPALVAVAKEP